MVALTPLTESEYMEWQESAIAGYAAEKTAAGNFPADRALELSRQEFAALLPAGTGTPRQHLYAIRADDGTRVGVIWLAEPPADQLTGAGFVYELSILPEHRRRGYATAAMLALEGEARRLGLSALALHVFGHNAAARALYDRLGYTITNINMRKELRPGGVTAGEPGTT